MKKYIDLPIWMDTSIYISAYLYTHYISNIYVYIIYMYICMRERENNKTKFALRKLKYFNYLVEKGGGLIKQR